jgi:hypothetical protein
MKLPPLAALSLGAGVTVAGESGEFLTLAEFGRYATGFVFAPHLAALAQPEPDFVTVAERFLNVPYLWGGKTSLGLDCSGLTQLALAAAGVASPRDSDMLEREIGESVLDRLERTDRNTELFAFLHIGNAKFFRGISDTDKGGRGEELPAVEDGLEK